MGHWVSGSIYIKYGSLADPVIFKIYYLIGNSFFFLNSFSQLTRTFAIAHHVGYTRRCTTPSLLRCYNIYYVVFFSSFLFSDCRQLCLVLRVTISLGRVRGSHGHLVDTGSITHAHLLEDSLAPKVLLSFVFLFKGQSFVKLRILLGVSWILELLLMAPILLSWILGVMIGAPSQQELLTQLTWGQHTLLSLGLMLHCSTGWSVTRLRLLWAWPLTPWRALKKGSTFL